MDPTQAAAALSPETVPLPRPRPGPSPMDRAMMALMTGLPNPNVPFPSENTAVTPRTPEQSLGWKALQQDLSDRTIAMMRPLDPTVRAATQQHNQNSEINMFDPNHQYGI
jgi:hypothetical protein